MAGNGSPWSCVVNLVGTELRSPMLSFLAQEGAQDSVAAISVPWFFVASIGFRISLIISGQ